MEWVCIAAVKHYQKKTNGMLGVEIRYVNPNENAGLLSSLLFGAENSHTFKQRNLKETQDFGRDFQITPEEGRYPSPIAWHCESLPLLSHVYTQSVCGNKGSVGNVTYRHPCITPEGHVLCGSRITHLRKN